MSIPDSVVEVADKCFSECKSLRYVTFGALSHFELIDAEPFSMTSTEPSVELMVIPESVVC